MGPHRSPVRSWALDQGDAKFVLPHHPAPESLPEEGYIANYDRNYHGPPLVLSCLVWGVWRTSRTMQFSWAAPRHDLRAWYFASAFVSPQPEPHARFL